MVAYLPSTIYKPIQNWSILPSWEVCNSSVDREKRELMIFNRIDTINLNWIRIMDLDQMH